jgi:adenine deaminase
MNESRRVEKLTKVLQRRVRVALGQEPGDLLLRGGQVINVFTEQIEGADVVIADGRIAGVGPYHWDAHETLDVSGSYIAPGLCDAHVHIESTLLVPGEFAKLAAARGTSFIVADPHEIANVSGRAGVEWMIRASEDLPIDVFYMIPSCVPASSWESAGATIEPPDLEALLDYPRVLGLAEMMNYPGVLGGDGSVLAKVAEAIVHGGCVDGHAPLVLGRDLQAYAAVGIRSDHESTTTQEALERSALGMLVQVRDGSMARNLKTMLPLITEGKLANWCLVTDDIHVTDLLERGHMDYLVQQVMDAGVPAPRAIKHASLVPARHYGLRDRGAVTPGFRADVVVLPALNRFEPHVVVHGGKIVAHDGAVVGQRSMRSEGTESSVHVGTLDERAFAFKPRDARCPVIEIVPDEILTRAATRTVRVDDRTGVWTFDREADVVMIACVERHRATGRVGLGLVAGLGIRREGAMGSSVAHDAHNLVVAGTNAKDMLACTRALAEMGGGFVVVAGDQGGQGGGKRGGRVIGKLPLPIAGLMSDEPYDVVHRQLEEVEEAARSLGCTLASPFGTLSFLCLSVIPELRITDHGLLDVNRQSLVAV